MHFILCNWSLAVSFASSCISKRALWFYFGYTFWRVLRANWCRRLLSFPLAQAVLVLVLV